MDDIDKLRLAWNNLLDEIAKALKMYAILDFIAKIIERHTGAKKG